MFPEVLEAFPPASFDAVCLFQILEHVADPMRLLQELTRLVRPGGILVVAVPDYCGPSGLFFADALTQLPPHHLSLWRASALRAGARRLGLKVRTLRREPLGDYLYDPYLPPILENRLGLWGRAQAPRLARFLRRAGIRTVPFLRGHSIYVVLQGTLRSTN
jgi:SAM-dependent methyltransferase